MKVIKTTQMKLSQLLIYLLAIDEWGVVGSAMGWELLQGGEWVGNGWREGWSWVR